MKLYELSKEMQGVLLLLESDEQEVDAQGLMEYMVKLEQDYTEKLDNIACMIKNEQAISDAIDNEVKNLIERKKQHENKALKLKEYVSMFMQQMGLNELETARNKISFRKSTSVEIDVEVFKEAGPPLVERVEVEQIPSKAELKALLKAGEILTGVEIIEKQNIQIK